MRIGSLVVLLTFALTNLGCETRPKKVAILPLSSVPVRWMDSIAHAIKVTYGLETHCYESTAMPEFAYINEKTPRYRADLLIEWLAKRKPDSVTYILGLTQTDISTTKRNWHGGVKQPESKYRDWGIFGLGYRPGPSSVVSSFRLGVDGSLKMERLKKISIHELGHNMGLPHCETERCVMQDAAESIKTIDKVRPVLCHLCRRQIGLDN